MPARVRVLFLIPALGPGGTERVLLTLLSRLDQNRFEAHVATLAIDRRRTVQSDIAVHQANVQALAPEIKIHTLGTRRARFAAAWILQLCWRTRPHVLFAMSAHLSAVILACRSLLPHGTALVVREGTNLAAHENSSFAAHLYARLYRRADLIVCQSEHMRNQLARHLPAEKLVCVYNPLEVERIRELASESPCPLVGSGPHLVWAGRLSEEKGIDTLLRAFAIVLRAANSARLTLVGCGPQESHLRTLAADLALNDCVRFAGWHANPYRFLKNADLLVLPSRYEGLPNVVLEALALGTPVLTTESCGGLHEIARTTERIRIVPQGPPESLAQHIVSALIDKPLPRAVQIEPLFLQTFGASAIVSAFERLLEASAFGHRSVVGGERIATSYSPPQ